ncbi:MAG: Hsp70 family protein [Polaromonas sp.]|uniref:Hsp70 family protein n=1 Tax=Polaromonas sp. TaxID=1869339 RepID=UPI00271ADB98|nr:Hsp70 family protein [Polaromonas sp.]MDO9115794.1 Hsp70 family protein [Polaromonas sp.]MDP1887401.1 Hsp70 family protein [Polaromonas sp.]
MAGASPAWIDACGIDFGTSNSTAGCGGAAPGPVVLLPLEDGKPTLPSVVFFHAEDGHTSYGRAALADYLAGDEGRLMRSLKSLLGTSLIDEQTEVAGRALPFRALLAQFIGELKRRAEHAAGRDFSRAVLGRPVFFVDGDAAADRQAENTLAEIARGVGLRDIAFQYEPIAAAFDYESQVTREELVLVVDIGGGTSDFALVRLAPERAGRADRRSDILASSGVHIGGTDFDKVLSLASVMPMLGLGSRLGNGLQMPSSIYFNLATWHTINFAYTRQAWSQIGELHREAQEKDKLARLQRLVSERAGHWLAMQVEEAKIALSDAPRTSMDLGRIAPGETLVLQRADFDTAIGELVGAVERSVTGLLRDAGVPADAVDTVFFTGGSSSVPLLRARIAALLPQARRVEGDRFGSIGAGLALDALRKFA